MDAHLMHPPAVVPSAHRTWHAVAGAVVGALVGVTWWIAIARMLLMPMGAGLVYPNAIALGAIVGYFTQLGAADRGRRVAMVAAVGGFAGMLLGDLLLYGPTVPFTFWVNLVMFPGPSLAHLLEISPLLILAAAAAAAVGFARLPGDLWQLASAHREKRPAGSRVKAASSTAPTAAVPPMAITPSAPVPPLAETRPLAVDAAPTTVGPIPAPVKESVDLRRWIARNRTLLLAMTAIGVVAIIAAGAFALGRAFSRDDDAAPVVSSSSGDSEGTAPQALNPDSSPNEVVKALYEAAATKDDAGVSDTLAFGFYLDPGKLEAWGDPRYQIENVVPGDTNEMLVQVYETDGGFSGGGAVTWLLREETDGWRVSGWLLGEIGDEPGFGGTDPGGGPLNEDSAADAAGSFLTARQTADVAGMRELATDRLESERPELFGDDGLRMVEWNLHTVSPEGDTFLVWVEETWEWSQDVPEVHVYVLVEQDGQVLVDEYR
ncbi:MAG: hypothetical protein CVT60_03285 [Actinobacteria bacterium HGW-Actinobacteria-10]|jgi:hypothetical protein|nr:MAG: hypothetical protein CVT60_03285 [Actinobacteria bacterium HGW-Actinobacteria-10]